MPGVRFLLVVTALAACGQAERPGVLVTLLVEDEAFRPQHVLVSWVVGDRPAGEPIRLPPTGELRSSGPEVATVFIETGTTEGERRVIAQGKRGTQDVSAAMARIWVVPGTRQAVRLTLVGTPPPASPGEDAGVPDAGPAPATDGPPPPPDAGPRVEVAPPPPREDGPAPLPPDAARPPDAAAPPPPVDLGTGLIGYWRLDDATGSMARDSSGLGHHGSLRNMTDADWVPGYKAGALNFDEARKAHVAVSSTPSLNPGLTLSVSAWVNMDAGGCRGSGPNGSRFVLRKGETTPQYSLSCQGGTASFGVANWTVNASVPASGWHHLAGVYDNGWLRLYVDGMETRRNVGSASISTSDTLFIGAKNPSGSSFHGVLDEVAIWGRALAASEIRALAMGAQPPAR